MARRLKRGRPVRQYFDLDGLAQVRRLWFRIEWRVRNTPENLHLKFRLEKGVSYLAMKRKTEGGRVDIPI